MASKKERACALLKGIESGDPKAVEVVDEAQYIQHNPLTKTGNLGLAELFARLAKTNPKVKIIRAFEDGDFVFAHTDYDFNVREVGFEVFRYENGRIVEHWDNLQSKPEAPNPSGHSMLDGSSEIVDLDKTEENRHLAKTFIQEVLVNEDFKHLEKYVSKETYTEHNFQLKDGLPNLRQELVDNPRRRIYKKLHRVLAEGNFALTVTEGELSGRNVSFYDLFRIENQKIVEHWDTLDEIPPREQWVNNNGKF